MAVPSGSRELKKGSAELLILSLVQDRAATPVADWIRALAAARVAPAH